MVEAEGFFHCRVNGEGKRIGREVVLTVYGGIHEKPVWGKVYHELSCHTNLSSQVHHLLARLRWTNDLISLNLSFVIYKIAKLKTLPHGIISRIISKTTHAKFLEWYIVMINQWHYSFVHIKSMLKAILFLEILTQNTAIILIRCNTNSTDIIAHRG